VARPFPNGAGSALSCPGVERWWKTVVDYHADGAALARRSSRSGHWAGQAAQVRTLAEVLYEEVPRQCQRLVRKLDRVLGGGLVAGSVVLMGGDPGIGQINHSVTDPLPTGADHARPFM